MSIEAIQKTGEPVNSVLVIIIEDDYPKLSSFCVIPNEAFGWGMAAQYETNYQWPKIIKDTTIVRSSDAMEKARRMASEMLITDTIDCVWIVNHDKIDVVK
jgi:sporulation protein YlmC with PRC-barrel domain